MPVAAALSSNFYQLQLIDDYRKDGKMHSLEELLLEQYNQSEVKRKSQQTAY